jgi:hypothetical protein
MTILILGPKFSFWALQAYFRFSIPKSIKIFHLYKISDQWTHLGVLSGVPPLAERFAYLNFRYLVAAFYRLGHPLRERLGMLGALNMGRCIRRYSDVLSLDIVPSESFTRHELPALLEDPLVDEHIEKKLANNHGGNVFISGAT